MSLFAGHSLRPSLSARYPVVCRAWLKSMPQTRSAKARLSHQERTVTEPREKDFHTATVDSITDVNDRIKTFRFTLKENNGFNAKFHPGQWLDVFVPGVDKAGGFTITSSPRDALSQSNRDHAPFFELAVQKSPNNPPAEWLWRPADEVQGQEVSVRVGGSFVWPPPGLDLSKIKRAIFIAGGVGINPMMSMLSYINQNYPSLQVRLLYSTKVPSRETVPTQVLYLTRLLDLFRIPRSETTKDRLELYFTGTWDGSLMNRQNTEPIQPLMSLTLPNLDVDTEVPVVAWTHRIDEIALSSAVGTKEEAKGTCFYVCGPPDMTDEIVKYLKEQEHVVPERVLSEKWW